jgi:hypothetical protein
MNYLPLTQAARAGRRQDQFFQNVKLKVIPRLIERGLLTSRMEGDELHVADDDAFRRLMRYGIDDFVYNQQGWSCVAIKAASMDAAAQALRGRTGGVLAYEPGVTPRKLGEDAGVQADADRRHVFLVKLRQSDWPVLIQTVHWFQSSDALLATLIAAETSAALNTRAVAAWDDDFAGSTAIVCDNGSRTQTISDEDTDTFYGFFYEQGIAVPECFISSEPAGAGAAGAGGASLLLAEPADVERADYFVLPVPDESQVRVPHALEKLGMMAEAIAEGLEDEEAFREHANDGLWQRVQALRTAAAPSGATTAATKRRKPKPKPKPKPKSKSKERRSSKPRPARPKKRRSTKKRQLPAPKPPKSKKAKSPKRRPKR